MSAILAIWEPTSFPQLLGAATVWAVLGMVLLIGGYKLFDLVLTKVDVDAELNKGNMAVGIVVGALLLGLAIIIYAAIH